MSTVIWVLLGLVGAFVLYWVLAFSAVLAFFKLVQDFDEKQEKLFSEE